MVVVTKDRKEFFVDDEMGEQIKAAITSVNPPEFIDLYGDGKDVIATSTIGRVHSDSHYDILTKPTPTLPPGNKSEVAEKWYKILKLNKAKLATEGGPYKQVPIIRSIKQYDLYLKTGEWPEYTDPRVPLNG